MALAPWAGPIVEDLATGEILPVMGEAASLVPYVGGAKQAAKLWPAIRNVMTLKDLSDAGRSIVRHVRKLTGKRRTQAAKQLATRVTLPVSTVRRRPGYGMNTRTKTSGPKRGRIRGGTSNVFTVSRTEEIMMVTSSDDPLVTIIPVSPRSAEMSEFLVGIAHNWQRYRINGIKLDYSPLGGDDVVGRVGFGWFYDPSLPPPQDIADLVSSTNTKWRSYNASFSESADARQFSNKLYVTSDGGDDRWTEGGYIAIISSNGLNADNGSERGVITITYEFEFMEFAPLREYVVGAGHIYQYDSGANTNGRLFGTPETYETTMIQGDISVQALPVPSTGTPYDYIVVPNPGVYLMRLVVAGGSVWTLGTDPLGRDPQGVFMPFPNTGHHFELAPLQAQVVQQTGAHGLGYALVTTFLCWVKVPNAAFNFATLTAESGTCTGGTHTTAQLTVTLYPDFEDVFTTSAALAEVHAKRYQAQSEHAARLGALAHGSEAHNGEIRRILAERKSRLTHRRTAPLNNPPDFDVTSLADGCQ